MRLDRLLGITMILLGRERVTARALAERFEVSVRTIQRDMEALAMAGLPVTVSQGGSGGYGLMQEYVLDRQWLDDRDFAALLTALEGMDTAFGDDVLRPALEKIQALRPRSRAASVDGHQEAVHVDFQATRQDGLLDPVWSLLAQAVRTRRPVAFRYTNARHEASVRTVEPLLLTFRWHAWYLFAFCRERQDYRLFRLTRIGDPVLAEGLFLHEHGEPQEALRRHDREDHRELVRLRVRCDPSLRVQMAEWFPRARFSDREDGGFEADLELPDSESHWRGFLLAGGYRLEVLEPESLREWMAEQARRILATYGRTP